MEVFMRMRQIGRLTGKTVRCATVMVCALWAAGGVWGATVTLTPGEFVVWDTTTDNDTHQVTDGIIALGSTSTVDNIIIENIADGGGSGPDIAVLNITVTDTDGAGPETIVIGTNQPVGTINISGLDAGTTDLTLVVGAGLGFTDADGGLGNDVGFIVNGISYVATTYDTGSTSPHGNTTIYTGLAGSGIGNTDVGATNFTALAVSLTLATSGTGDVGNLDFSDSVNNEGTNLTIVKIDAGGDAANTIGAITVAGDLAGASIIGNLNSPVIAECITGAVGINGNVNATADLTAPNGITDAGDINVTGDFNGDITVSAGAIAGDIFTGGTISGAISTANGISGAIRSASGNLAGAITITAGGLSGVLQATAGDIIGAITVTAGGIAATGRINAGNDIIGNITVSEGTMAGIIEAGHVISGHIAIAGVISGIITGPSSHPVGSGPDLNRDGIINLADLAILADYWLEPYIVKFYNFTMDTNPGWTVQGEWAFGQPAGGGGDRNPNPDPTAGVTGTNVYGVNLSISGNYSTTVGGPYYLTAGPFDCQYYVHIRLRFWRWLNVDKGQYVPCTVEVSNNGTDWQSLWQNDADQATTDSSWQQMEYDVSADADGCPTFYIRWSYQIFAGAYAYSGWNIDDVELWGTP
jgi:hypothetical protein